MAREPEVGGAVSEATHDVDQRDGKKQGKADRMPTAAEEKVAEELGEPTDEVAANYKESLEIGANVKGEGQID